MTRQIRDLSALCLSFINNDGVKLACDASEKSARVRRGLESEISKILNTSDRLVAESGGDDTVFYKQAIAVFCLQLEFINHEDVREVCEQITGGKVFRDGLERALYDIILRYENEFEPRGTLQ